jgi:thiol:disulfide interchange protein
MKKILFTLAILFSLHTISQAQGINFFKGTWKEALEAAQAANKPIFVDAYTTWCGPCKFMAAKVFTDTTVGEYYNESFINVKYDMEKGDGPDFANKYRVTAYPTLLYLTPEGKVLHRVMGAKQIDGFINEGKKALVVYDFK